MPALIVVPFTLIMLTGAIIGVIAFVIPGIRPARFFLVVNGAAIAGIALPVP